MNWGTKPDTLEKAAKVGTLKVLAEAGEIPANAVVQKDEEKRDLGLLDDEAEES